MIRSEGMEVIQAPTHPDRFFPSKGPQPQSMADVLAVFGFTHAKHLRGLATAWDSIFELVKPDVVVANYAPLSLLCARKAGIASVLLAFPFEVPPKTHPVPAFRPNVPANWVRADESVIATVNEVFGSNFVSKVYQIFEANKVYLSSFEELDAFAPRLGANYVGSLFMSEEGVAPIWPQGDFQHRVFGYLHPGLPGFEMLRQEIHASPHAYSLVIRDLDERAIQAWRAPNVCLTTNQVSIDRALSECDAVLSYGGIGLISACLLAGKPMVFHVNQLEQFLNAQQVVKLGAGFHSTPQSPNTSIDGLNTVLGSALFREAAEQFAKSYPNYSVDLVVETIANDISALGR